MLWGPQPLAKNRLAQSRASVELLDLIPTLRPFAALIQLRIAPRMKHMRADEISECRTRKCVPSPVIPPDPARGCNRSGCAISQDFDPSLRIFMRGHRSHIPRK